MRKGLVIPGLAVVSLMLAIFFTLWVRLRVKPGTPAAPPPQGRYAKNVAAVGLVEPASENIALSCAVSGMVTGLYVNAGDHVHKGQRLFSLDSRDIAADRLVKEAALASARSNLAKLEQEPRPEEIPPAVARVNAAKAEVADAAIQVKLIESVTDRRAVRQEDVERRRAGLAAMEARQAEAEKNLALLKAGAWAPDLAIARAAVAQAQAAIQQDDINIARLTTTAPIDGVVLQNHVRLGQYAQCGAITDPLMIFGSTTGLNLRADVDESDAWRVRAHGNATAYVRGNSDLSYPVEFVRFEPYVLPKKSLTGDSTERGDTRVLQVIFRFADASAPVYDGQQMDVFLDSPADLRHGSETHAEVVRTP